MGLFFLGVLLFLSSIFMMLLILVQRGKGGGLTGALGGMGGQSAFGSKAGDMFTRITVITAIVWITICMVTIAAYNPPPRPEANKSTSISSTEDSLNADTDATASDTADASNPVDEAVDSLSVDPTGTDDDKAAEANEILPNTDDKEGLPGESGDDDTGNAADNKNDAGQPTEKNDQPGAAETPSTDDPVDGKN